MLTTLQGIILRTVKYSESSVICEIYTRELGLRSYIMGGVRQSKAKIAYGLVRPMNWVEMVVYHREEKDLNRVKELKPKIVYQKIPFEMIRGSLGLFMTEVIQKTVRESTANEALYCFLQNSFESLDSTDSGLANFHLSFISKLAFHLGIMPDFSFIEMEETVLFFDYVEATFSEEQPLHPYYFRPEQNEFLIFFQENSLEMSAELKMSAAQRRAFVETVLNFYRYHFEHFQIHSHEILHQVLS
jgi:DNA repair protein RecO (recombination protein O)